MSLLKKIFKYLSLVCIFGLITWGCADKDKSENLKAEELKANIIAPAYDKEIIQGATIYFRGEASGGIQPYTYNWDFGAGTPPSSEKNPGEIAFNYAGAYKVSLTVYDANDKINIDFVRIIVEEDKYGIKTKSTF